MKSLKERLGVIAPNTTVLDLSKWKLNDEDLKEVVSQMEGFHNIEVLDISDNNFTYEGLIVLLNYLKQIKSLREIILSNNWLFDNSLSFIQETMIEHHIKTLRMCNIQLNENSVSRLCGLKVSSIEDLYLNDNSIGNKGLQFLLTTLLQNERLHCLYLCNNNISDTGVYFLYDFFENNHSVQYVDIRDNSLYKHTSVNLLNSINNDSINHHIDYTMPELSPELSPSSVDELVLNKAYKDTCVILQILWYNLHLQKIDIPLLIPKELVFNSSLQSHRLFLFYSLNYSIERIIKRLTEQPSLLAQRIQFLIQYIYHLDNLSNDPVILLVMNNLPLLIHSLQAQTLHKVTVYVENEQAIQSHYEIPSLLPSSIGSFQRCGVIKLKIIQLFECIIDKMCLNLIHPIIMNHVHSIFLNLFTLHPWNSLLHETLTSYFETVLASHNPSIYYDIIANAGLAHFVMKELLASQEKKDVGYIGFLVRIAMAIQQVYIMKSNLFFRLYCCTDENCKKKFPHPITRKSWNEFYCSFVTKHLNLCLVDSFYYDTDEQ